MPTHVVRNGSTWRRVKHHEQPVRGVKCRSTRKRELIEDPTLKPKTVPAPRPAEEDPTVVLDGEDDTVSDCDTESLHELVLDWEVGGNEAVWY